MASSSTGIPAAPATRVRASCRLSGTAGRTSRVDFGSGPPYRSCDRGRLHACDQATGGKPSTSSSGGIGSASRSGNSCSARSIARISPRCQLVPAPPKSGQSSGSELGPLAGPARRRPAPLASGLRGAAVARQRRSQSVGPLGQRLRIRLHGCDRERAGDVPEGEQGVGADVGQPAGRPDQALDVAGRANHLTTRGQRHRPGREQLVEQGQLGTGEQHPAAGGRGPDPMGQDGPVEHPPGGVEPAVGQLDDAVGTGERGPDRSLRIAGLGHPGVADVGGQVVEGQRPRTGDQVGAEGNDLCTHAREVTSLRAIGRPVVHR